MQAGLERRVAKRRSVTTRRCYAPDCNVRHLRDSPFCHGHAELEPESKRTLAGGTSELEDYLNVNIERALDRELRAPLNLSGMNRLPFFSDSTLENADEATEIGTALRETLPARLKAEFDDPAEIFLLQKQFKVSPQFTLSLTKT